MRKIVFFVEEESMKVLLDELLPRLLPQNIRFQVIPHQGKSDMEKSIPHKLRGWREPGVTFVILRDNDNADCAIIKEQLATLCDQNGYPDTLIRIVQQELESWYLGDLAAVGKAYQNNTLHRKQSRNPYRTPDNIGNPKQILRQLVPVYDPITGAEKIAVHMDIVNNRSHSFHVFVNGLRNLAF